MADNENKSSNLNIRKFDPDLRRQLKVRAAETGRTIGGLVEEAVKLLLGASSTGKSAAGEQ